MRNLKRLGFAELAKTPYPNLCEHLVSVSLEQVARILGVHDEIAILKSASVPRPFYFDHKDSHCGRIEICGHTCSANNGEVHPICAKYPTDKECLLKF